jgi:hypothetical protein
MVLGITYAQMHITFGFLETQTALLFCVFEKNKYRKNIFQTILP